MASSKKLKGITIEIDGNTQGLQDSLRDVNKVVNSTSRELRDINNLLKLDPRNTVLLQQKQKVLSDAIQVTSNKLKQLQISKQQADERIASGAEEKNSEAYRELQREIVSSENKLKSLTNELNSVKNELDKNSNGANNLGNEMDETGKKSSVFAQMLKANLTSTAITKAMQLLTSSIHKLGETFKDSLSNFADYEQLVGGVDTLFKSSSKTVQNYAAQAYKTAGVSANEYMEQVTSFSASLIQSLGGDTQKAAEYSNRALIDMSDNANKMGTDMTSIQNAYQGFAKQNYTMLD